MSDSDDDEIEKCIKLVVVGDCATGKTSLVNRFVKGQIDVDYIPTKGVEFYSNMINLPGVCVRVKIWDVGGLSYGGPLLKGFINGADVVLFVYDITKSDSFESIIDWLDTVKKIFGGDKKSWPKMSLVGNKVDLEHSRAVRIDRHDKFAQEHGMLSHFVSAKTGDSVKLCLYSTSAEACQIKLTQAQINRHKTVVRAEIQNHSSGTGDSGLRPPSNQGKLHSSLATGNTNNNNNSNINQDNSEVCRLL